VSPSLQIALSVYGLIFIAELPDKTALATLVLATRHRPLPVFVGAAAALAIQSLVAVGAGQLIALLPPRIVHVAAGIVFIGSAIAMWFQHEEADEGKDDDGPAVSFWKAAWISFAVLFAAEWGDLTQLATAALAARYRAPIAVFAGATAALWSVVAIAAVAGNRVSKVLSPRTTMRIAAVLFALVGVALVAGLF
jgi:putative Ca2+/H+ antiporter (TMEM165/GDT1 family)